jgi:hypothetical protein
VVLSFVISLLHGKAVDTADRFFNRWLDRGELELGQAIRGARTPIEVEQALADQTYDASAACFRHQGAVLLRVW